MRGANMAPMLPMKFSRLLRRIQLDHRPGLLTRGKWLPLFQVYLQPTVLISFQRLIQEKQAKGF